MRKLALVLVPMILGVAIPLSCSGCKSDTPATTEHAKAPFDVHYAVLYRDVETASAYKGMRIRCRLKPEEYKPVKSNGQWEVHVWAGDRSSPPILIFYCDDPPDGPITVIGTCTGPERDGIWRSPRADFRVTVRDCRFSR